MDACIFWPDGLLESILIYEEKKIARMYFSNWLTYLYINRYVLYKVYFDL